MAGMRKMIVSAAWVAAKIGSRQLANALIFFWLAFKLPPAELGVAALGVALAMFTLPLVTRGMREVIIQREALDPPVVVSAFCINLCLGAGLCLGLMLLAPVLAPVFGDPRLVSLGQVAALVPLLAALASVQESLWERSFEYRRITVIYAASAVIASLAAVAVTLAGQAVWALVTFNLATYGTVAVAMWVSGSWRPQARPQMGEMRRMLRFAAPVMLSQTIATGNQRLVEMLAGALLTPAAAAFLRFGGNFTRLLNQAFVTPVIQVLMPAFSRSKARPEDDLFRVLAVNSAILFFVFMIAAALLPGFIPQVFGEKWAAGGVVAAILCFGVFPALIGPVAYPLLVARGRGDWTAGLTAAGMVVMLSCVAIGTQFGAAGAAAGFVLRGVITIPLTLWVLWRALEIPPRRVLSAFVPFALAGVCVYLVMWGGVVPGTAAWPYAAGLGVQIAAGLVAYLGLVRFAVRAVAPDAYGVLRAVASRRVARFL